MLTDLTLFFEKGARFRPAKIPGRSDPGKFEKVLRWWSWQPGEQSGKGGWGGVVRGGGWGVKTGGEGKRHGQP